VRVVIVVLPLLAAIGAAAADEDADRSAGFVPLFNGKDLSGWRCYDGKAEVWKAEDGVLVCSGPGGGWLGSQRDYADFILRLEYRLEPGGNSGVYLRAPAQGHISRVGMEIQILDDDHPKYARLDYYQYTGSLYHVVPPLRRVTKPAGQWNTLEIRCVGRRLVVGLNSVKVVDADLDRLREDPAVAKEHPGLARRQGRLGLQSHSERVEFRRLRVKELPEKP
jgi:hypothetical protein